ncbi:protein PAXX isoform X2 [Saccopteryx bilineata]|uniref:protein PAXX isoform X2 n=1 Tax=Saccopteryx bilineata TaxID=59482 RepID=UPI00338EDF24
MVPPPPPPLSPPLCTLPPGPGPPRYVCYCEEEGIGAEGQGGLSLHVTDAVELWSTCLTPDSLAALVESPFRPECDGGHHPLVQVSPDWVGRAGGWGAGGSGLRTQPRFPQGGLQAASCGFHSAGGWSVSDPVWGALGPGLRAFQSVRPRSSFQAAGADAQPSGARVQLGAAAGSCRGGSCQPQEEPLASGASALLTRPRSSERLPGTWSQEAVSRRVPHQPWLQK